MRMDGQTGTCSDMYLPDSKCPVVSFKEATPASPSVFIFFSMCIRGVSILLLKLEGNGKAEVEAENRNV